MELAELCWPRARLGEALAGVAAQLRLPPVDVSRSQALLDFGTPAEVARFVGLAARAQGLSCEPAASLASVSELAATAPALIAWPGEPRLNSFLVLCGSAGDAVRLLSPAGQQVDLPADVLDAVWGATGAGDQALAARLDQTTGSQAIWAQLVRGRSPLGASVDAWHLRPRIEGLRASVKASGGGRAAWAWMTGVAGQLVAMLAAWWVIGVGALEGRLEPGRLAAWALLLATVVALRSLSVASAGRWAVAVGTALKDRLLDGILRLAPETLRTRGVGQLLGIVLDAEALEALARAGGPVALVALGELLVGAILLLAGAAPGLHLLLLLIWGAVALRWLQTYKQAVLAWGEERLTLTHDLVERMIGHRTRAVQLRDVERNDSDARYEEASARMDAGAARLAAFLPRLWLLFGVVGLSPSFVRGEPAHGGLALSVGGLLLVFLALRRLAVATPALAAAALAWRRTRPLVQPAPTTPPPLVAALAGREGRAVVVGRELAFSYPGRPSPVLRGCTFELRRGDRVLLQGPSGAGKSTLGAMIAGLRWPHSGVLLLAGLDHHSVGAEGWRQRSAAVPQFHDNHVLSAPLAFNVLMGRRWPPTQEDLSAADQLLRALGLGELLDRMPMGLWQMVGDSGWQLSHGERSRVFVARSLLQDLEVRVLDESLAGLDPATMLRVLDEVLERSPTLVVVAHT